MHRNQICRLFLCPVVGFSSATAFLLLLLSGCDGFGNDPMSYQSVKQKKQEFVELIEASGGSAEEKEFKQHGIERIGWVIDLSGATISDEIVDAIVERNQNQYFGVLNFSGSTLTDDQLITLEKADIGRSLLRLNLSDTGITDQSVDQLNSAILLMELDVSGTRVSTKATEQFSQRLKKNREDRMSPMARKILGSVKIRK